MATLNASRIWIPPLRGKCVAYYRVSTRPFSRLNEDAQRRAVQAIMPPLRSKMIGEFIELEPLEAGERTALNEAVQLCKNERATLLIGQIDRMRSGIRWLGYIATEGVKFRGADVPQINHLSYNQLVSSDYYWRREMGQKVSDALAEAKDRGLTLGGDRGNSAGLKLGPAASATARQAKAMRRDAATWAAIEDVRYRGVTSLTGIAKRLNQRGHRAPRGGAWSPAQVQTVIKKFER
ncbi:hypothetical protein EKN06_00535 [Croceicoccus ponticola]|uniref:Recombinase family protein n=2 Tax=Croceicoccus ponticola TaxID=2217664 RepID=A0A437GZG9_9SPHN|nr:hypothetical protein EKN06_00535 [Croceicoccus ponticola]